MKKVGGRAARKSQASHSQGYDQEGSESHVSEVIAKMGGKRRDSAASSYVSQHETPDTTAPNTIRANRQSMESIHEADGEGVTKHGGLTPNRNSTTVLQSTRVSLATNPSRGSMEEDAVAELAAKVKSSPLPVLN